MNSLQQLNKFTLTFNNKHLEEEFGKVDHKLKSYLIITTAFLYFCQLVIYLSLNGINISLIVFSCLVILLGILGKFHQKLLPLYNLVMQSFCCYFLSTYVVYSDMPIWRAFMNGQTVGSIFLLGSKSFIFDTLSVLVSQGIIMYICKPPVQNYLDFIQVAFINILTKYIYYLFARQTFINQRSIDSWYSAIDKLFQNNIIITKFEPRTCNISLHECNEYARRFNIHQSDDSFRQFLMNVKLQSEKRNSRLNSTRATANSVDFISLKEYLIQKYYKITNNKQQSMKQIGEELIGFYEKQKQVIRIKMKIGLLFQDEPYLIITFNDRIDEDNIKCLKKEISVLKSLFMISTISNKIKSMEISNYLQMNRIQLAKQKVIQQYTSLASIEEYIKQIIQKDSIQQITYNKISMKNLVDLIKNIYPTLKIEIDSLTLQTIITNDLQKIKTTIFYLISLIHDQYQHHATHIHEQWKQKFGIHRVNSYSNCNTDSSTISLVIQNKQSFLYDSISFQLKGIDNNKPDNLDEISSEKVINYSGFREEQIVKEIQKECIRYYISQIGPNNSLPEKKIIENENQFIYEFEIFKDIKNLSSKKAKRYSEKIQSDFKSQKINSNLKSENFIKQKNFSFHTPEYLIFNQNIRYNTKIISNNSLFVEYCQRLNKIENKQKNYSPKHFSLTNTDFIQSNEIHLNEITDEKDKEETSSFNIQPQFTVETNRNIPQTFISINNNDLALKTLENA
ncbi:hypothetical protein ABPG74_005621 [Tetrahymena malaccensis]